MVRFCLRNTIKILMKEILTKAIKKVTLELIYEVVDERTKSILEVVNEIRRRQEEDFRYLNNKIDTQVGQLRQEMGQLRQEMGREIGQLRQEIGQLRQEITQLNQKIDTQIAQLNQKIDSQIAQLNQRIDTVIQLLIDLKK
ncbi:hypothetical protein JGI7_01936 [Candidatus Kryptonium thompsonii]|jgi:methyl-accepting chemotaxis protein|uniref:Uncharacterized protein n=2 Tax=Candidatus Kryptonium thompsonii TaxID=1633631 RepID=A0A0N7MXQ5_9BACT|nr:hypothetical protein JGI8_00645 [Candidatus Kryptonium thompsoni]CUS87542.1 hypothetical protein JGI13_01462 [Candidatus Kryptonium thompsoni]CUS88142.1 hypothetical protein JGI6_01264 [Candidatus Kryptonium thompsoni]CUS88617.1 hypothetical protein JGI12_01176 [Candidatus Kryptonium thompsoni]CUS94110.1 hypothetical protein JGI7_01936 [Candidatus Kryptonium thompsoni]